MYKNLKTSISTILRYMIIWLPFLVVAAPGPAYACQEEGGFLTFPHWFDGIPREQGSCGLDFSSLDYVWTIVGNVVQILLQLVAIAAVIMVIYGGIRYITSQGSPEQLQRSKQIIVNAVIGLVVAILAATIVGFIAGRF